MSVSKRLLTLQTPLCFHEIVLLNMCIHLEKHNLWSVGSESEIEINSTNKLLMTDKNNKDKKNYVVWCDYDMS